MKLNTNPNRDFDDTPIYDEEIHEEIIKKHIHVLDESIAIFVEVNKDAKWDSQSYHFLNKELYRFAVKVGRSEKKREVNWFIYNEGELKIQVLK